MSVTKLYQAYVKFCRIGRILKMPPRQSEIEIMIDQILMIMALLCQNCRLYNTIKFFAKIGTVEEKKSPRTQQENRVRLEAGNLGEA
eukprot:scaffold43533_cov79-Cyclotella_meneghiniana.AAC.1